MNHQYFFRSFLFSSIYKKNYRVTLLWSDTDCNTQKRIHKAYLHYEYFRVRKKNVVKRVKVPFGNFYPLIISSFFFWEWCFSRVVISQWDTMIKLSSNDATTSFITHPFWWPFIRFFFTYFFLVNFDSISTKLFFCMTHTHAIKKSWMILLQLWQRFQMRGGTL